MGQSVVEKVVVEVDGRVGPVQRAFKEAGKSLDDFAGKANKLGGPGGLGDTLGGLGGRLGGLSEALAAPAAGAGILAVALTGLAAESVAMAEDVSGSLRRVRDGLGETDPGALDRLRASVVGVRAEVGASVAEVAHLFETIERGGAGSAEGVTAMARAVYLLRDADGGQLEDLAGGLDAVLDTFGLASTQATNVAATLSAVAKGKVPLEDLLAVFGKIAPVAQQNGLGFEQLVGVVGDLLDQNVPLKQVVSTIEAMAAGGKLTAGAFDAAAAALPPLTERVADLNRRAQETRDATGRAATALKEEFAVALLAVGDTLGGILNGPLRDLRAVLTDGIPGAVLKTERALASLDRARARGNVPGFGVFQGNSAVEDILGQLLGNGGAVAEQLDAPTIARLRAALERERDRGPFRLGSLNPLDTRDERTGQALSLLQSRARELDEATTAGGLVNKANQAAGEQLRRLRDQLKPENVPLERLRALKTELQQLATSEVKSVAGAAGTELAAVERRIAAATTKATATGRALVDQQVAARAAFASATASLTPAKADDLETKIAALVAAAGKAKLGADEIARLTADLRAAAAAKVQADSDVFNRRVLVDLAANTGTVMTAAQQALAAFDAEATAARNAGLAVDELAVARLRAAKAQVAALADEAAALDGYLGDLRAQTEETGNLLGEMGTLQVLLDGLGPRLEAARAARAAAIARAAEMRNPDDVRQAQDEEAAATRDVNTLLAERAKLLARIAELQGKVTGATQSGAGAAAQVESRTGKLAGHLKDALNLSAGLAAAFGGVNSELARSLTSLAGMAGGVEDLLAKAKQAGGLSKLSGLAAAGPIAAIVTGGFALGSALGVGQPTAAEVAARQAQEANTKALRELATTLGALDTVGTRDADRTAAAVAERVLRARGVDNGIAAFRRQATSMALLQELARAGLSFEDFRALAKQRGIEIGDANKLAADPAELRALLTALASVGVQFADLGERLDVLGAGALERLTETLAAMGQVADTATQKTGSVARALAAQFDLSTKAGRDAALAYARARFAAGEITADIAKQIITLLEGASQEAERIAGDAGTADTSRSAQEAASAAAQLTEATGLSLVDYARSHLGVARQGVDYLAGIAAALRASTPAGPIAPPDLSRVPGLGYGGSPAAAPAAAPVYQVSVRIEQVVVQDGTSAEDAGRGIGLGILDTLGALDGVDRGLAQRALHHARAAGATPTLRPAAGYVGGGVA